jgi:hypothetical protein
MKRTAQNGPEPIHEEIPLKLMMRTVPLLLVLLFGGVQLARAQGVSAYFGLGTATDKSSGIIVDSSGDKYPSMGGVFGKFGADFFIKPHLGIGGEYIFRFAQQTVVPASANGGVGISIRPTFYDFNAMWHPSTNSRIVPEVQGGLGGADIKFYGTVKNCVVNSCSSQSQLFQSSNHFQLHLGVGLRLYVRGNLYVRPQFDLHWVHNLTDEFGRSWVPEYGAVVGYTFGAR